MMMNTITKHSLFRARTLLLLCVGLLFCLTPAAAVQSDAAILEAPMAIPMTAPIIAQAVAEVTEDRAAGIEETAPAVVQAASAETVSASARTITYLYDNSGRMTQADLGGGKIIQYAYDTAGNRVTQEVQNQLFVPRVER
jgi:YD repeat-containing protein